MFSFQAINSINMGGKVLNPYNLILLLSTLVYPVIFLWRARKKNIPKIHVFGIFLIFFIGPPLGAHLWYLLLNPSSIASQGGLLKSLLDWRNGLVTYGCFLPVLLILVIYTWIFKELNWKKIVDMMAPFNTFGLAIQRIGCLLHGCCFGKPTNLPWGILYSPGSPSRSVFGDIPVHPTQIYYIIANLLILFVMLKIERERKNIKILNFDGSLYYTSLVLFSTGRFIISFFRYYPPESYVSLGITALTKKQLSALFLFAWAAYYLVKGMIIKAKQKKPIGS